MDIQGYCQTSSTMDDIVTPGDPADFRGKTLRVIDWAVDGDGGLCVNSEATAIAAISKKDMLSSFKCDEVGNVICKPGLNELEKMLYMGTCNSRKGGYPDIVKHMVVAASLHRGEFNDGFLWDKQ